MKSFTTAAALASIVPAIMSLTINTPSSVVQCQPQLITWNDGAPPYYLSVIPGGQPGATPLKTFDTQSGNGVTWIVDQASGTKLTWALKDSTGAMAYTDIVTVQKGSDSSCLTGAGSPPPSPQDASVNTTNAPTSGSVSPSASVSVAVQTGTIRTASNTAGVTATRAASVAPASTSQSATQSVSRTTTSARTAATSSSGAESRHNYGFVGVVGLIGALFL